MNYDGLLTHTTCSAFGVFSHNAQLRPLHHQNEAGVQVSHSYVCGIDFVPGCYNNSSTSICQGLLHAIVFRSSAAFKRYSTCIELMTNNKLWIQYISVARKASLSRTN